MDNAKNKVSFDFSDNAALKALFSSWQVGESYSLNLRFQLNELGDQGASGTIEEVTSEEEEEPVTPDRESPVMITMGGGGTPKPYESPA